MADMALIFENTFNILRKNKFKFYGKIFGIYILACIFMVIIVTGIANFLYQSIMAHSYYYSYSYSLIKVFFYFAIIFTFIVAWSSLIEIIIIKVCFKLLNRETKEINFSRFIKIFGGQTLLLLCLLIAGAILTSVGDVMNYLTEGTNKEGIVSVLMSSVASYFLFIVTSFQIMIVFDKENYEVQQKENSLVKAFELMHKFFSWRIFFIIFSLNIIISSMSLFIEKILNMSSVSFYTYTYTDIGVIFAVFLLIHFMILFATNYFIQYKNEESEKNRVNLELQNKKDEEKMEELS